MNILAGVYKPDSGQILLNGNPIVLNSPHDSLRLGIALIHQELSLVPALTVAENIFLGQLPKRNILRSVDWRKLLSESAKVMKNVGVGVDPQALVRSLSTGQQQQIEICRAFAIKPNILIMDEPTSALTKHEVEILFSNIRTLKHEGITVIYISHRLEEVREIAERLTILRDGKHILTKESRQISPKELSEAMLGHEIIADQRTYKTKEGKKILLSVSGLSRRGQFKDVSFSIREGEILGFAGLLGAGKTELLRAIDGLEPVDQGQIKVQEEEVHFSSPRDAIKKKLFLIPEDRKNEGLVQGMSISDNITLPYLKSITRLGFVSEHERAKIADEYISRLSVKTPSRNQKVLFLSGGNQQKVVLARWLSMKPSILLLDQPTRGIDIGAKEEIYQLMRDFAVTGGCILFVATEISELLRVCGRVLVMNSGRIVQEFDTNVCTENDIFLSVVGGISDE
jgi:ribose transport system ATP-binding protein